MFTRGVCSDTIVAVTLFDIDHCTWFYSCSLYLCLRITSGATVDITSTIPVTVAIIIVVNFSTTKNVANDEKRNVSLVGTTSKNPTTTQMLEQKIKNSSKGNKYWPFVNAISVLFSPLPLRAFC